MRKPLTESTVKAYSTTEALFGVMKFTPKRILQGNIDYSIFQIQTTLRISDLLKKTICRYFIG